MQPDPAQTRIYRMAQILMSAYAKAEELPPAEPRGVVTLQDALESVLQVAAVVDENVQAGVIPAERGAWAVACLMAIRDYLQPLPPGYDETGRDLFTDDLQTVVDGLRSLRAPDTVPRDSR